MKKGLLVLLAVLTACPALADKRDFKGLFGSYRRERFIENEGNDTDVGLDLMLSTLLPITPFAESQQTNTGSPSALNYATFFNLEGSVWVSLNYNWVLFGDFGYYSYNTRKQTATAPTTAPYYHTFDLTAYPMVLGAKYRFSREDFVPYVGLGLGMTSVHRTGGYDNNPSITDSDTNMVATGEVIAGLEYYFSSRAGLRMEISALYMKLTPRTFAPSQDFASYPELVYQPNTWSVRYASGVFFLF